MMEDYSDQMIEKLQFEFPPQFDHRAEDEVVLTTMPAELDE